MPSTSRPPGESSITSAAPTSRPATTSSRRCDERSSIGPDKRIVAGATSSIESEPPSRAAAGTAARGRRTLRTAARKDILAGARPGLDELLGSQVALDGLAHAGGLGEPVALGKREPAVAFDVIGGDAVAAVVQK